MKLSATVVAALSLFPALAASSQAPFTDPANLGGEHVTPLTGREIPLQKGTLGLAQMLRKLNTRASLMLIVAHPDDEDGGMLTLVSRGLGARVADLSLTRGEGGQNAMTGDFEDALGLIRTQELLSADRYTGVNQFFGTEVDFGFSKTKEEAFAKWTHQRVLYDAVRAVRIYRPLVIAAVFIGGVTDGHGQHQVSGEIAQEVFKAAGDPTVFPELTAEGILPWQPLKVYARVPSQSITPQGLFDYATGQFTPARFTNYVTGEVTTTPPSVDVTIHEGETDPLLTDAAADPEDLGDKTADPNARPDTRPDTPLSYVQFARIGLGLQRTQIGPGVRLAAPGAFDIGYHRYGSMLPHQPEHEQSFFDGIDTTISGVLTLVPEAPQGFRASVALLQAQLAQAASAFDSSKPAGIAPTLADALQHVDSLLSQLSSLGFTPDQQASVHHELAVKRVQINEALSLALGLTLDATASEADQPAGAVVPVWAELQQASPLPLQITAEWLQGSSGERPQNPGDATPGEDWLNGNGTVRPEVPGHAGMPELTADRPFKRSLKTSARDTAEPTRPYFFRTGEEAAVYQLRVPALRLAPATPPALTAFAGITFRGVHLELAHVVEDHLQPFEVVPAYSLALSHHAEVLPHTADPLRVLATVKPSPATARELAVRFVTPGFLEKNTTVSRVSPNTWQVDVRSASASLPPPSLLQATAHTAQGETYTEGYRPVGYPGIPYTNFYTPATDRVIPVDLNLPTKRRIAYLQGTGDAVPEALASIHLPVTLLKVSELTPEVLAGFDTVVLGVRTYNAHPELHGAPTAALLDFARRGGNVVVQYQTGEFTGADAPYPLELGNAEKVVDETTPVRLLDPASLLLTAPNRITPADFNGWVEERGHGFLHTWDPHYIALTETHDPGGPETRPQAPQEGGLLTTPLGRGHWTYCAFALYRQLPEAVPGAFRLFVNLLGLADR